MMNMNESLTFTAQSTDDEGNILLTMNASVYSDGSVFLGKNIADMKLYLSNKDEADADYAQFERNVFERLSGYGR